ncbi:hypothetical protein [uncultured Desulfobacter sp.]|uniref:hypothetical protein n=1 Tax=uncultured Desulfobacter sp. TaxID=240139 RepID=UPI0029F4FDF6|nr:hypothetical protein [uncultured Desulfobacter sp.]
MPNQGQTTMRFMWLPKPIRKHVNNLLEQEMPRGRGSAVYRTLPAHLDKAEVNGKRHLVFVCYYAYPSTIKKSVALRRTGRYHTTLIACCIRQDLDITSWFDDAYEVEHYKELFNVLNNAAPTVITACIQPSLLGAIVLEVCPDANVVVDIMDSGYFMRKDPNHIDSCLERAVLQRANTLVHKMPSPAIKELRAAWDVDTPDVLAHCLPMTELFQDTVPPPAPPYRIVYAGGIMPYHAAVRDGHEHMIMDPIIRETADQNILLTFLANLNARDMFWEDQQRYFDHQKTFSHFAFRPGVPFYQLPSVISNFHYGLLYDQTRISSWRTKAYAYNMSTKIFSYFEAGLPLLVYSEFEYICEIVNRHGLGVVYSLDKLDEIPALLAKADYERLRANVKKYRNANNLETLIPTLEKLYGLPA